MHKTSAWPLALIYAALIIFVGALFTAVVDERAKARAQTRARPRGGNKQGGNKQGEIAASDAG